MKKQPWLSLIVFALLVVGGTLTVGAQTYSMDWFKIAGGGGTSSGGAYSVSGTIGQPDAGAQTMSGGNYSLNGGFWAFFATVQTPGAPKLGVILTSTNTAVVFWPSSSNDWNLQQTANLNTINWVSPSEALNSDGVNNFIVVKPAIGTRLYRLSHP